MTIAIIGGGASGVLTAINLLLLDHDEQVVIFERGGLVGRGVAYGTTDRRHLLNVRARHMSAFPDSPGDLLEWARATGRATDPQGFLPRADYAIYLQDRLRDVADDRLVIRAGEVTDLAPADGVFELCTQRRRSHAGQVVLAHGNLPPRPLEVGGTHLGNAAWNVDNPWDPQRLRTLDPSAHVLLVGSGLTAMDTAITLLEEGPNRHITMISRSGSIPYAHVAQTHVAWVTKFPEGPLTAAALADTVHSEFETARARDVDWRAVIDGVRPSSHDIWARLPYAERERFISEFSRAWDVRRHRMPREVADQIERYRVDGRLTIRRGSLVTLQDRGPQVDATLSEGEDAQRFDAIVNCTGPRGDMGQVENSLLQALAKRGLIAPGPLGLGLDADVDGRVRGTDGFVVPGLFVLGPPRRGSLWETTAIPEIRTQAASIASLLLESGPRVADAL